MNAFPDKEACLYAGISPATLYSYQQKHPEFAERKEQLKLTPNMAARKTIVRRLDETHTAQWWLEKKDPDMRPSSKVEHSGSIETTDGESAERSPAELKALADLKAARLQRIRDNSDKMV